MPFVAVSVDRADRAIELLADLLISEESRRNADD